MTMFFKIKKKPYSGVTFAQREFLLKTPAMYNCRGLPAFKCQKYKADWLFLHYQYAKTI